MKVNELLDEEKKHGIYSKKKKDQEQIDPKVVKKIQKKAPKLTNGKKVLEEGKENLSNGPFIIGFYNEHGDETDIKGVELENLDAVKDFLVKRREQGKTIDEYVLRKAAKNKQPWVGLIRYDSPPDVVNNMVDTNTEEGKAITQKLAVRSSKKRRFYYKFNRWNDWEKI